MLLLATRAVVVDGRILKIPTKARGLLTRDLPREKGHVIFATSHVSSSILMESGNQHTVDRLCASKLLISLVELRFTCLESTDHAELKAIKFNFDVDFALLYCTCTGTVPISPAFRGFYGYF